MFRIPFSQLPHGHMAKEVMEAAVRIRENAYAPYSKFMVGAAILTDKGNIFAGCNVESADYDGTHAEEAALATMVAHGERSALMLAVYGAPEGAAEEDVRLVIPCGKCRQKLFELASLSVSTLGLGIIMPEYIYGGNVESVILLSELLPEPFGPAHVGVDLAKYRR